MRTMYNLTSFSFLYVFFPFPGVKAQILKKNYLKTMRAVFLLVLLMLSEKHSILALQGEHIRRPFAELVIPE